MTNLAEILPGDGDGGGEAVLLGAFILCLEHQASRRDRFMQRAVRELIDAASQQLAKEFKQ